MHFLYNDTSFLSPMGIYGSKSFHKVRYHDYRCYALGFFFTGVGFVSIKKCIETHDQCRERPQMDHPYKTHFGSSVA